MPICPGCEGEIPHHRLDTHLRHCTALGDEPDQSELEELDRKITDMETRLNRRLLKIQARVHQLGRDDRDTRDRREDSPDRR
jgi:hypothetical protein